MTAKIDLVKRHKAEYAATRKPALIEMKAARYVGIAGEGAPGAERFVACIGGLYAMAFTIKMTRKFAGEQDYTIGKLECQYLQRDFCELPREKWRWRLLIRTPEFVTEAERGKAVAALLKKGKAPEVAEVELVTLEEGRCAQALHVGPYDREGETLAAMREFAAGKGFSPRGDLHEIYLSDPRRVAAEKLRTILRAPLVETGKRARAS